MTDDTERHREYSRFCTPVDQLVRRPHLVLLRRGLDIPRSVETPDDDEDSE